VARVIYTKYRVKAFRRNEAGIRKGKMIKTTATTAKDIVAGDDHLTTMFKLYLPNKPFGLNIRTSKKTTKDRRSPYPAPITKLTEDSRTPISNAAKKVPNRLPNPPRMTMVNSLSTKMGPVVGVKEYMMAYRVPACPAKAVPRTKAMR
jgi:hypothetical protein